MFAFIIFEFKVHMYNTMYNNTLNNYDPALMGLSSTCLALYIVQLNICCPFVFMFDKLYHFLYSKLCQYNFIK